MREELPPRVRLSPLGDLVGHVVCVGPFEEVVGIDATRAIALRLDERRHVLVARSAGLERIRRRVSHFQRVICGRGVI